MTRFSKSLELNGANSTTSYVLWSMIIFLIFLIGGLGYMAIKQLKNLGLNAKRKPAEAKDMGPKGFN